MLRVLSWILILGHVFILSADTSEFINAYQIEHFEVKDFNRNSFTVVISAKDEHYLNELFSVSSIKLESGEKISKFFYYFEIYIGNIKTEVVPGSLKVFGQKIQVDVYGFRTVPSGETRVSLIFLPPPDENGNEQPSMNMHSIVYEIPPRLTVTPTISDIKPSAGTEGDLITVTGKNLGREIHNVNIYFVESRFGRYYEAYNEKELGMTKPIFISPPDVDGNQEMKFLIPMGIVERIEDADWLRNKIRIRVLVNYTLASQQTDKAIRLDILYPRWKQVIFAISFGVVFAFLGIIPLITGKINFLPYMLKDQITNTYSLSRFQAFVWTITLFASYLYIALCYGLLKDGEIPEFNMSLLGLMGISYGSLISANHLSKQYPKNELRERKAGLFDLIMHNGSIDITRFQMFSFTILTVVLYIFNLYNADILMGMPDIPTTLHGLLLSSQAGYLGGKITGDKIVVNQILPSKVKAGETKELTLIGNGFTDGMKIMIDGQDPIRVKFLDPTTVRITVKNLKTIGNKNLLLIPVSGSSVEIHDAIEVVSKEDKENGEEIDTKG